VTSRALPRIASPRLLPGNSYKHLDDPRVGSRERVSSDATTEAFSRMSDQGFIGETEASSGNSYQSVLDWRQEWNVRSWRRADRVN
jgi:hypothetical protein